MEQEDIHFKCDACKAKFKTEPKRAGKLVKCKNCGTIIFIPTSSTLPKSKTD